MLGCACPAGCEQFLRRKWEREQDYVLRKYYWAHRENRIAVCFGEDPCRGKIQMLCE